MLEIVIARGGASIAIKDLIFNKSNIKYEMETELEEIYKEATEKIDRLNKQHPKMNTTSEDRPQDDITTETAKTLNKITMDLYIKMDKAIKNRIPKEI